MEDDFLVACINVKLENGNFSSGSVIEQLLWLLNKLIQILQLLPYNCRFLLMEFGKIRKFDNIRRPIFKDSTLSN